MNSQPSDHPPRKRLAIAILLLAVLAAPVILYGARGALKSTSNDPRQWLPRRFEATDTYDWFQEQFGTDEIAVVSWPGCTLDDARVPKVAAALEQSPYFDTVRTGPSVVAQLTSPPSSLSRGAAISRLRRILIGGEDDATCLVLTTSKAGEDDRTSAVAEIESLAQDAGSIARSELKLAGPTVDAAMIDAESRNLLFQLAGLSALVSFAVASLRLRSIRMAIAVLVTAGYCTVLALAMLYFSGGRMNLLMTMLPPLIYVLTISSAVHLANYYRDAVADGDSEIPPALMAVRQGWLPCSLAAVTTGIGLISLVLSKIEPIQSFGFYSALGVTVGVVLLFLLLPSALYLFPPKFKQPADAPRPGQPSSAPIIDRIIRNQLPLTVVCLLLMAFCGWRIPMIKSTVKLQDRFLPSSDAIADYRWLENHIGPMVPLEVVIHFDRDDQRDRVDQLGLVTEVQSKIQKLDPGVATLSAVNFCPPLPRSKSIRDIVRRKVVNGEQTGQELTDARFLSETDDETLWRISVRADAIGDMDYGLFAEKIRSAVEPFLAKQNTRGTFTGVIPLIYKAQRQLLLDLFRSFLVAFVVIAAVLVVVLRSIPATCLAMIPNIFPAVIVFGGIEWIGVPVQIGSVMTASAALGIAVDDTVHVLTWFRRGLDRGLSRHDAIRDAFSRCAGAMVHTTLICACGLIVFALSSFVPILHFAYLMVFLLGAALVGDLILLPSILAGPLGRCFDRSELQDDEPDSAP